MGKVVGCLTAGRVAKLRAPGRFADGGGLFLNVTEAGGRAWLFRYQRQRRAREMSLGNADVITLAEARKAHTEARALLAKGLDPLDARHAGQPQRAPTFAEVADAYIADNRSGWRGRRTEAIWRRSLAIHVHPMFGAKPVDTIATDDVLRSLRPIWTAVPVMAGHVRNRIELILDYAKARGWRSGENPAAWRGNLKSVLPAKAKVHTVRHHAALPWQAAPGFMTALRGLDTMAARCLAFCILTAVRSDEARGARWDEIDLDQRVWVIPAARTKTRKLHRVPLSEPAVVILRELDAVRSTAPLVFQSAVAGCPMANNTLLILSRSLGNKEITVHGMRSTFRDWCAEHGRPFELAEAALAHVSGSAVVQAYQRSDLLDQRRGLMDQWGAFLSRTPANVVQLSLRAAAAG